MTLDKRLVPCGMWRVRPQLQSVGGDVPALVLLEDALLREAWDMVQQVGGWVGQAVMVDACCLLGGF